MSLLDNIHVCPSTLQKGFTTYSPKALRLLFDRKKISHTLSYNYKNVKKEEQQLLIENKTRISISGVQEKFSTKIERGKLVITNVEGEYILKPIPRGLLNIESVPANEHVTMQIAEQVFGIETAKNGLIFFADGSPAYITRRFDVLKNKKRSLKEDFASLAGRTSELNGKEFKYEGSYADIAALIDKYIPAAIVEKEKFFRLVVFNYLFSNGDAHLKNFSVIDYEQSGFYMLAPAYDLICTRLHIGDGDFALNEKLYAGDFSHPSYQYFGYHSYDDFYTFAERIGVLPHRIKTLLDSFLDKTNEVEDLVFRSFLNEELQKQYLAFYADKLKRLNQSLSGKI